MLNDNGVFIIDGKDVYDFYDKIYYGMSFYVLFYQGSDDKLLFTITGIHFEKILKIVSTKIAIKNPCVLLKKFIDAGCDFDFDFQTMELKDWWEIPDKNLLLENLVDMDMYIQKHYHDDSLDFLEYHDLDIMYKSLIKYLIDSKDNPVFIHYA